MTKNSHSILRREYLIYGVIFSVMSWCLTHASDAMAQGAADSLPAGAERDPKDPRILTFRAPPPGGKPNTVDQRSIGAADRLDGKPVLSVEEVQKNALDGLHPHFTQAVDRAAIRLAATGAPRGGSWVVQPAQVVSIWKLVQEAQSPHGRPARTSPAALYPGWIFEGLMNRVGPLPDPGVMANSGWFGLRPESPAPQPSSAFIPAISFPDGAHCIATSGDAASCTLNTKAQVARLANATVIVVPAVREQRLGSLKIVIPVRPPEGESAWGALLDAAQTPTKNEEVSIILPVRSLRSTSVVDARQAVVSWMGEEANVELSAKRFSLTGAFQVAPSLGVPTKAASMAAVLDANSQAALMLWAPRGASTQVMAWLDKGDARKEGK